MVNDITIVISCAGMGTRLGIGCTKALIDINGKPLIIRQLEMLNDYEDICIVVGYQAEQVIQVVSEYRKDIRFAFNHEYRTTGTGASLSKAITGARDFIISLDGDLLVHPYDLKDFIETPGECLGGCIPTTDDPVLMKIQFDENKNSKVVEFSRNQGDLEWTGLAKIRTARLIPGDKHVYQMLENLLPLQVKQIRSKEIDTTHDYEKAIKWFDNEFND